MAFPSTFWQPVGIKKVLSADFKLFRTVSDHFRTVPDRFWIVFGPFQTVFGSFRTILGSFLDRFATIERVRRPRRKKNDEQKICGPKARKFVSSPSQSSRYDGPTGIYRRKGFVITK